MSYVPAWVFCIPDRDDPKYYSYLINEADKDVIPEHVRIRLIDMYLENYLAQELEYDEIIKS